jgi:hypothetical protein
MLMKTSSVLVYKFSPAIKHGYLLKYLLEHNEDEICTVFNDRSFSLMTKGSDALQKFFNIFSPIEYRWILKTNGIDRRRITRLKSYNEIRHDDIVICYNILNEEYRMLENVDAFKALSMLHFHGKAGEDEFMKKANISCFFNEVDLSKTSAIFQKYYHITLPWVCIPFVFAERFKNNKPFNQRKNKAFSVGTITYKIHPEFIDVYGNPCDQPVRKFVKDNPDFFAETADCYSSDYLEDDDVKEVKPTDNVIVKFYKRVHNRFNTGRQKKYFSFDMVEKFNEYKMHVVGEEILGIPGIGYVEGMACGSAYIGLDSPMYRDLGLIPGVHYIAYDGTKEGLRSTIEYWQRPENQSELEKIAATGCKFVRENFRGDKVAHDLIEGLKVEQQKWLNSRN